MGDCNLKFARLRDYGEMIKQTNPGSSFWLRMDSETGPGKNLFVYFYVCLDTLKKGWMKGCRRIIGFDGYFLKGACKGELLVAVGKNGNNQMFPIAWAVVDKETEHSWSFFVNYLKENLQLGTGAGLTVMADMQKGFHVAVLELLPNAEIRRCARHIWANWSQEWKGEERKNSFGNAQRESRVRAFFKEHCKYDAAKNNMCGTFNSWIVVPKHKSIITMLEEIRRKIMSRTVDMIKFSNTWICDIAPMARLILKENKDRARACKMLWNADVGFEVGEGEYRHTVNLNNRVRRVKKATTSIFCGDTRIHVTEGIKSQLPPRSRVIIGQKRGRVGTTKDVAEGGSKRTNVVASPALSPVAG
ncbi:uncharacterized protein LOC124899435 [Capsicum annuum]|uniref:uncharacterized protein LOC124899435 n=1 Tax=Capsicum annuum TaxID=4072 RepID=UPI001FB0F2F0|nr:uncharacterized protein LOC124899435 [Capsicum annuum]